MLALAAGTLWGCVDARPTGPSEAGAPSAYTTPWAYYSGRTLEFRSRVGNSVATRCMDVAGASRTPGARITIWECLDGPQQTFRWYPGTGEIRVYDGTADVQCVANAGATLQAGDPVIIWPCDGGVPQRWEPLGTDAIRLQGTNLCIDVPNGDPALGNGLILWYCNGYIAQQWDALIVNASAPSALFGVYGWGRHFEARSAVAADRCMGVENASRANGARVVIAPCTDGPHQTFLWDASTRAIRVYDRTADEKCVDDGGGALQPGDPVIVWPCHGGAPQRWEPTPDGAGMRLEGTNLCIDVPYGDPTPGTGLIVWHCWGGVMQVWTPATVFYATMDGWQPTPNGGSDHNGTGAARFTLLSGGDHVCVNNSVNSTRHGDIIDAHIHPSPRSEGSPMEIAHWGFNGALVQGLRSPAHAGRECVPVGAATVRRILDDPDGFYYNVHTLDNPIPAGGILRGQLSLRP